MSIMNREPAVYILTNKRNGTLYVGVTSSLIKRIWEHRNNAVAGFTKRYELHLLVWYEMHNTMESAIKREKTVKGWRRIWKLELIEASNPNWKDLYTNILGLDSGLRRNDGVVN
jgi:putative endonuclease